MRESISRRCKSINVWRWSYVRSIPLQHKDVKDETIQHDRLTRLTLEIKYCSTTQLFAVVRVTSCLHLGRVHLSFLIVLDRLIFESARQMDSSVLKWFITTGWSHFILVMTVVLCLQLKPILTRPKAMYHLSMAQTGTNHCLIQISTTLENYFSLMQVLKETNRLPLRIFLLTQTQPAGDTLGELEDGHVDSMIFFCINFSVMTRRITFGRGYCNKLEDHLEIFDTSPVFGNIWIKTPDAGILGCLYIWGLLEKFVVLWLRKTFWAEWRFLQEDGDSIWISRVGLIGGYCVFLEGLLHIHTYTH